MSVKQITFATFRRHCINRETAYGNHCSDERNTQKDDGDWGFCRERDCPIWKRFRNVNETVVPPNVTTRLRIIVVKHIRKTPHIPEYVKPLLEQVVRAQINMIGTLLGNFELCARRVEMAVKEDIKQ